MVIVDILVLIVGFAALIKGADLFVDGSASLARKLHVSSLIIGLTIVALGTSAPELAVSTTAAFQNSNDLAISNVVGSNLFNLLVVLGACAVISTVPVSSDIVKRDFPFSIVVTVAVWIFAGGLAFFSGKDSGQIGTISRLEGIILLAVFIAYIVFLIIQAKNSSDEEEETYSDITYNKCILLIISGLILIVVGGQAVVESAKEIAYAFGMSETLVGLTIVAVGTSLPELVTSIVASRKHENGLAVGNVVGSNIFNLMFILGTAAVIRPMPVDFEIIPNMVFLIGISVLCYIVMLARRQLNRTAGIIMVAAYVVQVVYSAMV